MKTGKQLLASLLFVLLTAFGIAVAQDGSQNGGDDQTQTQEQQSNGDSSSQATEFAPVGEIQVGDTQPYDTQTETVEVEVETGAIIFTGTTPEDQHPNVDLVGPNGFYQRFEVDDAEDAQHVVDGLVPGIYSVAATDDGLQLAHTIVEVVRGQAVQVHVALNQAAEDFQAGVYGDGAVAGGGAADGDAAEGDRADDAAERDQAARAPGFPGGAFQTETQRVEGQQAGQLSVETPDDNARFVVTGPDNYSREFSGSFTVSDLMPGIYIIAGTADGHKVATQAVEVNVDTRTVTVPTLSIDENVQEESGVAGGGEGQEGQQQDQETQPENDGQDGESQDGAGEGANDGQSDVDAPADGDQEDGQEGGEDAPAQEEM